MHARTLATLDELKKANWFDHVGVADTSSATVVSTWKEAIQCSSSAAWQNLCLEVANQYRERLMERNRHQYELWNQKVISIKPLVQQLVQTKTAVVDLDESIRKQLVAAVEWDILHLCMEAEYADIYPPGFYASQGYWYLHGHFPCGWSGDYPSGKLIIY